VTYDYALFMEGVFGLHGTRCWVSKAFRGRDVPERLRECDGVMDAHHCLRKNRLKQEVPMGLLADALNDRRNGIPACRRHHDLLENAHVRLFRSDLPAEVHEFARDFGLEGWLDRYYPRAAA
jgi:hypothetical protein